MKSFWQELLNRVRKEESGDDKVAVVETAREASEIDDKSEEVNKAEGVNQNEQRKFNLDFIKSIFLSKAGECGRFMGWDRSLKTRVNIFLLNKGL